MRKSARTGMAVAVAGAASGLALLGGGTALAATGMPHGGPTAGDLCNYKVNARHGLHVRQTPRGKIIPPALPYGHRVLADCTATHGGWVELHGGVPVSQRHGVVYKAYLKLIKPSGGVSAGGGGTSEAANPLLAGVGIGTVVLGAGVAIAARRRQTKHVAKHLA